MRGGATTQTTELAPTMPSEIKIVHLHVTIMVKMLTGINILKWTYREERYFEKLSFCDLAFGNSYFGS